MLPARGAGYYPGPRGATGDDVRALIELVEEEVRRGLGFSLEREVLLVGDWSTR